MSSRISRISMPVGRNASGGRSSSVAYRLEFLRQWDARTEHRART
ncbi:hypothetical protein L618_004200000020 [Rhodococcus rhodochrous J45]|uniref:Uncharacterized protein n=1 Tax=Rhodococcus rhodochrous J45 TaxID=935266 RepID=A0A562DKU6_RHORH|nr:hypothetical protein [Rhodococcus rhodochrous]TWH10235.1 hypothetical protein L618_004200000020 [Rhodococcus rhodochrous J45]